jgi:hypothetical protein
MSPSARLTSIAAAAAPLLAVLALGCGDEGPLEPNASGTAVIGDARPAVAAASPPAAVPFRGVVRATEQIPDPSPPAGCVQLQHVTHVGKLTHLGQFRGMGTTCLLSAQPGVTDPPFLPSGPPPYFVADFTVDQAYTAANGDVLLVSGEGVLVQSMADGSGALRGHGQVDGGTGRFDGATGDFDVGGADGVVRYDGWIAYDASSRAR